ncbi:MAG: ABC transporter permease subunit [Oscillochloris sp.]|nr:ABC transporter permease subunit [Oscillochloris sp.]
MRFMANPVLTRELRGRIRGNRALILLIIYLTITGAVTLLVYAAAASAFSGGVNDPEAGRGIGKAIFLTVMTATLIQVCVITPSLTSGTISGEKERQSYDLLITTLLSPFEIALGKLTAALAFALLLIIAALPMAGLSFLFGGVSGTELIIGIAGLIATAVCYATIGLLWSTVMRTTLAATVMALGTVLFILLAIPFLFVVGSLITNSFNGLPGVIYVYTMGLLLSAHPFIALGITSATLTSGESPFFFEVPTNNGEVPVPSPWLVYLAITTILTVIFLILSVRMIRPVNSEMQGRRRRKGKPVEAEG